MSCSCQSFPWAPVVRARGSRRSIMSAPAAVARAGGAEGRRRLRDMRPSPYGERLPSDSQNIGRRFYTSGDGRNHGPDGDVYSVAYLVYKKRATLTDRNGSLGIGN